MKFKIKLLILLINKILYKNYKIINVFYKKMIKKMKSYKIKSNNKKMILNWINIIHKNKSNKIHLIITIYIKKMKIQIIYLNMILIKKEKNKLWNQIPLKDKLCKHLIKR